MQQYLKDLLTNARVFDLGMPYFTGMPHHPNQPPFAYTLTKKHGDITLTEERVSFCNDLFVMGGHAILRRRRLPLPVPTRPPTTGSPPTIYRAM